MTEEQKSISGINRKKAIKYFEEKYEWFKNRTEKQYAMHHKDKTLRHTDIERYIQWNIEDLVILTFSEHSKIHCDDNAMHMDKSGENNPFYGKHHSKETLERMANQNKVKVVCVETGVVYNSVIEAADAVGIKCSSHISQLCKGTSRCSTCGGYHWKYYTQEV